MSNEALKHYADRDIIAMDRAGNYYIRHVAALTQENLYSKSDIAAELGWRDMEIDRLRALASLPEGAPNPDSDHPAGLAPATSSGGPSFPRGMKRGPIQIATIHRGAYFDWAQAGCGWGQLSFEERDGKVYVMNEAMGREWIRKALYALADHVAETGVLDIDRDELHAKVDEQRVIDGGENGATGSTKGSKGAAIDEATKP